MNVGAIAGFMPCPLQRIAQIHPDHLGGVLAGNLNVLAHPTADVEYSPASDIGWIDPSDFVRGWVIGKYVGERQLVVERGVGAG